MGIIFSGGQKAGEAGAMENKRKAIASWTMRVAVMSAGVSAAVPACGVCVFTRAQERRWRDWGE